MNRYKRGWFGESRRHYLAAKGVKTKPYYAKKYDVAMVDKVPMEEEQKADSSVMPQEMGEEQESIARMEEEDVMDQELEKMKTQPYGDKFFNLTGAITSMGHVTKDVGSELAGMADWFRTTEYYAKKNKKFFADKDDDFFAYKEDEYGDLGEEIFYDYAKESGLSDKDSKIYAEFVMRASGVDVTSGDEDKWLRRFKESPIARFQSADRKNFELLKQLDPEGYIKYLKWYEG